MRKFTSTEIKCIVFREKVTTRRQFNRIMLKERLSAFLASTMLVTNKYNSPSKYFRYFDLLGISLVEGLEKGLSSNDYSHIQPKIQ